MSQVDLSHLLGKSIGEVEKPKPFPMGHYGWVIASFSIVESTKKKTPGVEFVCKMTEAKDDVDQDELALVKNASERSQKLTFWLTEDSLWRLKEFCVLLGITSEDDDRPLGEILPEATSQQFVARIVHETIEGTTDVIAKLDDRSIAADE